MPIPIPALLGPWLVGFLVGSMLTGIDICVLFSYYKNYPKDIWFNKIIVLLSFLLAFGEHITAYISGWYFFITARSSDALLNKVPKESLYVLAAPVFAAMVAHVFFINRAFRLARKNFFILVGLGICACASLASGIAMLVTIIRLIDDGKASLVKIDRVNSDLSKQRLTLSMFNWIAASTDLVISLVIAYFLLAERKGFSMQTDTLLVRIVKLAFTTAGITALFAMGEAICVTTQSGKNNSNVAVNQPITHMYFLSIASTLLLRERLKENLPANRATEKISGSGSGGGFFSSFKPQSKWNANDSYAVTTGVRVDINVATQDEKGRFDDGIDLKTFDAEKQQTYHDRQ